MSILLKLKEWLTVEEASNYLTKAFHELVKPRDLFRLAIENKLVLSLFFVNNTYIEIANTSSNNALLFNKHYQQIKANSYCDLVNRDKSTLILKQHYYNNSVIPLKADNDSHHIIVCLSDGLTFGRLIDYKEQNRQLTQVTISPYLPSDTYLIIRTDYLNNLINQATQPEIKPELHPRERTNTYLLIAILSKLAKLPIEHNYKTAKYIYDEIAPRFGITVPSQETLAKYFKNAYNLITENN